ncbi:alpha/beta hydrolase family protein [Steroidobacter sp.]|uniref:S9 family peptidase n=1 Tax=Steroidobacter sp. TaxID=1978227 RepID=UPI0025CBBEB6|nr:S9 family peptidase [Steroidobacter sp.]
MTVALASSATHAVERRVVTHQDIWLLPRVGAPAVSPNGKLAVFSVTEPAYSNDQQVSDLWLVATDGKSPARRLTQTRASESGVTWSPDGARIAYATRREADEVNQIYIMDLAGGGEALRATTLSTGARLPKFSPDGRKLAFTSDVPPESRNDDDSKRIVADEKSRKYKMRVYDSFPIRNWDVWLPENRQPHAFVQTVGVNDARDLFAGTDMIKQPGFGGRSTQSASELDLAWAPDGESLVFSATRNANRGAYDFTNAELWQVAVAGGEPRRLTGSDDLKGGDSWSEPEFSADGRSLYALREIRGKSVFSPTHLAAFDWPSLKARAGITLPAERDPLNYVVAPNSRDIYLLAEDAGHSKVYRGKSSGGEAKLAFDMKAGGYGNLVGAEGAPVLLANFDSAVSPNEIVRIDPTRGTHLALTRFSTDKVAALDMEPVEHFWFESKRGARIHNMIVRPPNFDATKKYPLLVLMHGGPHSMWRDNFFLRWNYHLLASPGYVVLLTNYTGSTGFGAAFSQAIQGDPLQGPALEINQAADEAIARYPFIDSTRQCAGGASYGGHLANWMQASTTRYRCLISHAGLINLESQWATSDITYSREQNMGGPPWQQGVDWNSQNPIRYASQWKTPVLVTVGERDFRVPLNNTLEYWSVLQRQQVESRLLIFPDENHWIQQGENSRQFFDEVQRWLARYLKN